MEREQISGKIRQFFESSFPQAGSQLNNSTDLLREWFVDSFGIIETVLFLEEKFGVQLNRADISAENFGSVDTLTDFVMSSQTVSGTGA